MKKYLLYLLRWQLSTPILAIVPFVLAFLNVHNYWVTAIIANLIGGIIFFWVDKLIFKKKPENFVYWEIKEDIICVDCGERCEGRRVVLNKDYNREKSIKEFRCKECAKKKLGEKHASK